MSAAYSDQQLVVSDSDAWNTGYAAAAVYHVSDDRVYGLHDHRGVCSADFQFPENPAVRWGTPRGSEIPQYMWGNVWESRDSGIYSGKFDYDGIFLVEMMWWSVAVHKQALLEVKVP